MSGKQIPITYATEAESSLLACLAYNNAWISETGPLRDRPDWTSHTNRRLIETVFDLIAAGKVADENSICEEYLFRAASEGVLVDIADIRAKLYTPDVISPLSARTYAEQIIRAAYSRAAAKHAEKIAAAAFSAPESVADLLHERDEDLRQFSLDEDATTFRYQLLSSAEAINLEPSFGILGNILYESSIAILFARSGRWKSFLAQSIGYAVASGGTLFGRQAKQGSVVYVAAEGARNIGKRLKALQRYHADDEPPSAFHVLGRSLNLLDQASVSTFIRDVGAQLSDEPPALVIIDTIARSMPGGDENAAKDINTIYDALGQIKAAFDCCVLAIHHDGKEAARGARGSSAIYDNADTVLTITGGEPGKLVHPGDVLLLECSKPKEDEQFEPIAFTTQPDKWATDDGQFVSSLVVVPASFDEIAPHPLTDNQLASLRCLLNTRDGLVYGDWERMSGLGHGSFANARKALDVRGLCRRDSSTKRYFATAFAARTFGDSGTTPHVAIIPESTGSTG